MAKYHMINRVPLVLSGVVLLAFLAYDLWISEGQFNIKSDIYTLMPAALICLYLLHKAYARTPWGARSWIGWLCFGCFCSFYIIVASYQYNYGVFFHIGLMASGIFLTLMLCTLQLKPLLRQFILTALFGIVLLPLADIIVRPSRRVSHQSYHDMAYAYDAARSDPVRFKCWWDYYLIEWFRAMGAVQMPDPKKVLPFRLKPNSRDRLFDSEININSLGFRDAEFPQKKQGELRIIALGESTTMGCTIRADDVPWPKVLEKLIQNRLKPMLPVRVINAGVAAYTLEDNLRRLEDDILPLDPDIIISYHGYNGFPFIDQNLPEVLRPEPPPFVDRPLYLLAKAEYRLNYLLYLRQNQAGNRWADLLPAREQVLDTYLAKLYKDLIAFAHQHKIRLVLANFNMAVNQSSQEGVIDFYRGGFPHVRSQIRANIAHTQILESLAQRNPDILYLNTHKELDGRHVKFIDLVHFTQAGREQLAENIFEQTQGLISEICQSKGNPHFKTD